LETVVKRPARGRAKVYASMEWALNLFAVGGQEVIDGLSLFQSLLHLDQLVNSIDQQLNELALRFLQTGSVGYIIDIIDSVSVLTACTTLLELKAQDDVQKLGVLAKLVHLEMNRGAHACAQIARTSADVTESLTPCELGGVLLHKCLDLLQSSSKASEDGLEVAARLHGDDTALVLLVDPDQKRLLQIVPDASRVRPVTDSPRVDHQMSSWLLEQEVVINELLLLLLCHLVERVILAGQVP